MYNILGILLLAFVFGLIFSEYIQLISDRGSFLDSIFDRSKCDSCNKEIPWYALIPIIGRLITKKKCVHCGKVISSKYLWFEVLFSVYWGIVLFILYYLGFSTVTNIIASLFVVSTTLLLAYEDLKNFSVPATWLFTWGVSFIIYWYVLGGRSIYWFDMIGVILVLGLSLFVVKFSKKDKSIEYKDMFGLADVLVLALLGAIVGFQSVTIILVLSMVSSLFYLKMKGKEMLGQQLPLLTMMLPWSIFVLLLL